MSHERRETDHGVVHHLIRVRDGALGKITLSFVKKGGELGFGSIILTSNTAQDATLSIDSKFKTDFIRGLRTALDEWEKI